MAAKLRATWALLFLPTWPAAVDQALLLDERSFRLNFCIFLHKGFMLYMILNKIKFLMIHEQSLEL